MKFAHSSEKLFADHLDLYNITWYYEPTSFPLEWGSGAIKKMFTPDFFLPDYNLYIEITTMNQSLITKKQKKTLRSSNCAHCLDLILCFLGIRFEYLPQNLLSNF